MTLRWATVTDVAPLRIRFDGDADPLPFTPESLIDPLWLTAGDRVRCELAAGRVVIHGRAGGVSPAVAGASFARANRIRNADFRVNQRGYVSGAGLPPQQYGPDGWCASGINNLATNPQAETNTTGWTAGNATLSRITSGQISGAGSFQLASPTNVDSYMALSTPGLTPGKTYTISATAKLAAPLGGTQDGAVLPGGRARRIYVTQTDVSGAAWGSPQIANVAGTARLTVTFTLGAAGAAGNVIVRLYLGHTSGTIVWDDITIAEGIFTELPAAASGYSVTPPTITLPSNPGALATLSSGGRIFQPIERQDVTAGDWIVNWEGTAQARVYNANTPVGSRPAFQDGPIVFAADGADDVIVEAQATGGACTFGNVSFTPGTVAQPYVPRLYADELAICQRYFVRWVSEQNEHPIGTGFEAITTSSRSIVPLPAPMRETPVMASSGLEVSNNNNYRTAATIVTVRMQAVSLFIGTTHAAVGAAISPNLLQLATAGTSYLSADAEIRRFAA